MFRLATALFLVCLTLPAIAAPCAGFTDVENTDPFCPNVTWIKNRNITLGCAQGLYCPSAGVSRLAMAAFLNRLGDVLLPPNVIWVAPTGGQFQSIQTAIDAAAADASATQRRLIKLAPGEYSGPLTLADFVDIEGSGYGVSVISADGCAVPTVTVAAQARLREVMIRTTGTGQVRCVGVRVFASQTPVIPRHAMLRDVAIEVQGGSVPGEPSTIGLNIVADAMGSEHEFDNLRINVVGGGATYGVLIESSAQSQVATVWLRDGRIWSSYNGGAYGVSANRSRVFIERVDIRTFALGPQWLLEAKGQSNIGVRDSFLGALGASIAVDETSAVTITNTELFGSTPPWARVSCYNVFARADVVVPVSC